MKIRFKLVIMMVVLSLSIVGVVGIPLLVQARINITGLSHDKAVTTAMEYAAEVEYFFASYWYTAQTMARTMEQYENIPAALRRFIFNHMLEGVIGSNPEIAGIWCIWEPNALEGNDQLYLGSEGTNETGRFAAFWYRDENGIDSYPIDEDEILTEDYYQISRKEPVGTILAPYPDNVAGEEVLMTSVTASITDGRRILGVVGIDFTVNAVHEMAQANKPFGDGVTAVFSNDGTIVSHFDTDRIGGDMEETERDMTGPYYDQFLKAVHNGELFYFTNYIEAIKTKMNVIIAPIHVGTSGIAWSYAVAIPEKTVMASLLRMEMITLIIGGIVVALIFPFSLMIAMSISRPILKIANNLKDIAEGEGDLTQSIVVHSQDEIGSLALYFNETLVKIKNLIINIRNEASSLSNIGINLASNMNETAAAVNEITHNIQSIKDRILNQSASVSETHATMEQLVVNIKKLNTHVENQSDNVSQASSAIEEMVANTRSVTETLFKNAANVKTLTEASEEGRSGLHDVAADIQEIARESEGLLQINSVMENIASQTSLLSMNAAIEAAHAGESGKGFSVVAAEIRKLAVSSSEQSKTIGNVLKKIKTSIDKITVSTEKVLNKFEAIDASVKIVSDQEEIIRTAMEEQGEGSKQILEGVSNVNNITRQVRGGSNEMHEGAQEVIRESENLEKATQEITSCMNEMATGAEHINLAVNHVNEITKKNRDTVNMLMKEVERFKVE
jgi:methyl-accepting chemotaxis protein